ncbi:hypothetical protein PODOV060v1_p0036 [Vibrio phage 234P8]|nr:hypothetical protein PODOV060v1_p0036 [Vibrio phage 234P8]
MVQKSGSLFITSVRLSKYKTLNCRARPTHGLETSRHQNRKATNETEPKLY